MTTTLTKTVSQIEFETTYESDPGMIHRELYITFKNDNPGVTILSGSGFSHTNEDGSVTYTLTIEYEA